MYVAAALQAEEKTRQEKKSFAQKLMNVVSYYWSLLTINLFTHHHLFIYLYLS